MGKLSDPYQVEGAKFLAARKLALIADDAGLGKTGQLIHACDLVGAKKILVICPAAARINWYREFDAWSLYGADGFTVCEKSETFPTEKTICSFDYIRDHRKRFEKLGQFDVVIIDESHNLKEPEAKVTGAVYNKSGIVRQTDRVWLASATPAPNNYSELWTMLYTFGLTKLSWNGFINRYCHLKFEYRNGAPTTRIMGSKTEYANELKLVLNKISIRRLKDVILMGENIPEHMRLKPIIFESTLVEPCPVDLELHPSFFPYTIEDRMDELLDKLAEEEKILEETIKRHGLGEPGLYMLEGIQESVATLRRFNGLKKVKGIVDLVSQELKEKRYQKIVIFCVHRDLIEALRIGLKEFHPVTLYGKTPAKQRQLNIDNFQTKPHVQVFIGNIKAAGVAITLTAASEVMMAEWQWTPGVNEQAIMRVHRRGQVNDVRCRFVAIANSIDAKISYSFKKKATAINLVFEGSKINDISNFTENEGENS